MGLADYYSGKGIRDGHHWSNRSLYGRDGRRRVAVQYEYRRCDYGSREWEDLREDGYQTIAVNRDEIALMRRQRQTPESGTSSKTTNRCFSEPPLR